MTLQAPITRSTHRALRAAVLAHRESHTRRQQLPVSLHAGDPLGFTASWVLAAEDRLDAALRADIAAGLLLQCRGAGGAAYAWLCRGGTLELHDADVTWGAAVRAACAEAGARVPFVVVTRDCWVDPVSGVRREWQRLRRWNRTAGRTD